MKVLFFTNIPAPYRVDFFNALGKECDLTVLLERSDADNRDHSWLCTDGNINFRSVFMKGRKVGKDTAFCPEAIKYWKDKSYDVRIIGDYATPTGIFSILYMKMKHIPYMVECDGGAVKENEKKIMRMIKTFLLKSAKSAFSPGHLTDEYLMRYGVKKENICFYPFTSICEKDLLDAKELCQKDKDYFRKKLHITEKKVILSVGRFSYENGYGKGYDILLKVSERLDDDTGVYIVGDEPTEEFVKLKEEKKLEHVHYIGFKEKKDLAEYYAAADVFVLLTRGDVWGLVINEAMTFGLPVITTYQCIAGTELVKDGVNGYLTQPEDVEYIEEKIKNIIDNPETKASFGRESLSNFHCLNLLHLF